MQPYKTYLNNLGIINALGSGKQAVVKYFLSDDPNTMSKFDDLLKGGSTWVGAVKEKLVSLPEVLKKYQCRNNQLIATAYQEIAEDVEALKARYGKDRIGVILGTSTSGIAAGEDALKYHQEQGYFPEEFEYSQQEIGNGSEFLAEYAGVSGAHYTVSTACSSSGKAFAAAYRLIQADMCDAVIVGGSDSLCKMTLNGFDCLDLVSQDICNPFSQNRKGLNIGEGAALFILSKQPSRIALSGIGESSDGHHISTPDPEAKGAENAIKQALDMAGHQVSGVGYINLHGTATGKNDEMESLVTHRVFGNQTPCSSTKSLLGHTLGAAAAHELGLCWLLLSEAYNPKHKLPAQIWDGVYDETLKPINITKPNSQFRHPVMMSNSFAFGGSNVSLVIEKNIDLKGDQL